MIRTAVFANALARSGGDVLAEGQVMLLRPVLAVQHYRGVGLLHHLWRVAAPAAVGVPVLL